MKKSVQQQIEEFKNTMAADIQRGNQIRQEAKAAGTWGTSTVSDEMLEILAQGQAVQKLGGGSDVSAEEFEAEVQRIIESGEVFDMDSRDGAEVVEQARKYLEKLNKETGANVQQDLGQYWENYGNGPEKTAEEYIESYGGDWEKDRAEAAEIREEAIADGTWGKSRETEIVETSSVSVKEEVTEIFSLPADNLICGTVGFVTGSVIITIYFKTKMKQLKIDCETRVNEARAALDRMLKIASKE